MAEEIKVLQLDQENKVIYANVLITQALFYCIRRSVKCLSSLLPYTWMYFTGSLYFPSIYPL